MNPKSQIQLILNVTQWEHTQGPHVSFRLLYIKTYTVLCLKAYL